MSIGDVVKLNFTTSPISYFDIRAAGDEGVCIDDYDVSLLKDHASVGDQNPLSAFYQTMIEWREMSRSRMRCPIQGWLF